MREVEIQVNPTGTDEAHELELTFELAGSKFGRTMMDLTGAGESPLGLRFESRSATVYDCQELLGAVDDWVRAALTGSWDFGTYLKEMPPETRGEFGSEAAFAPTVRRLHYGSPFQVDLLLPLLTPAGLAGLFFIARRLYGIDLEFKAHREQRRVEYLEAKAKADLLAGQELSPSVEVAPPDRWKLTSATLRDPSS